MKILQLKSSNFVSLQVEKKKVQTTLAELKSKYSTFENVIDYVAVSGKTLKGIEVRLERHSTCCSMNYKAVSFQ